MSAWSYRCQCSILDAAGVVPLTLSAEPHLSLSHEVTWIQCVHITRNWKIQVSCLLLELKHYAEMHVQLLTLTGSVLLHALLENALGSPMRFFRTV